MRIYLPEKAIFIEPAIYFDNADDNMTLTLYNVTLTSRNHFNTVTSTNAAKQTVINEAIFY